MGHGSIFFTGWLTIRIVLLPWNFNDRAPVVRLFVFLHRVIGRSLICCPGLLEAVITYFAALLHANTAELELLLVIFRPIETNIWVRGVFGIFKLDSFFLNPSIMVSLMRGGIRGTVDQYVCGGRLFLI